MPEGLSETGAVGSLLDWRSYRLRRACASTIYAEAMSSRAGSAAGAWTREFLLEIVFADYKATIAVEPSFRSR